VAGVNRRLVLRTTCATSLLALVLGCEGPAAPADETSGAASEVAHDVELRAEAATAVPVPALSPAAEAAIAQALRSWLLTGDCRAMTDGFLRERTPGVSGDRRTRCAAHAAGFTVPALSASEIVVRDVAAAAGGANAVVTDHTSGIQAAVSLVRSRAGWRIRSWET
jgi:hypothetical protein